MTTTGTIERIIVPVEWKAVEGDTNSLEGYASTFGNVDLQADVVERGAFKRTVDARLGNGKKIPFLADHHAHTHSVLGSITEGREDKKGLRIRAEFSSAPSAQDTRIKMLEGHIDRLSIGYEPVDWSFEERDGERVRRLKEVRLWEISAVVFPANTRAVVDVVKSKAQQLLGDAVRHGGFDLEEIKAEFADRDDGVPAEWFEGLELIKAGDGDSPEDKRAIRSHSTATSTGDWDGPANEARLPNDAGASTYRRMYAWVDPGADADTKAAYKFPHHEVSADGEVGAANVAGCRAGIAVLNGARGGADIDGRSGVYAHLARHLRDADVEPPELSELGDEPPEQKTEKKSVTTLLAEADALLEGDPAEPPDEVTMAAIKARNEARLLETGHEEEEAA